MIGVIADDLTGAAEIGAVGLRHGLRAEILLPDRTSGFRLEVRTAGGGTPALICIDTDSRSCASAEAARRVAIAVKALRDGGANWLFKKVDSVLRGPVLAELAVVLAESQAPSLILAPANPALERTIRGGRYYVRGVPIHETEFARDPEHPRTSSDVLALLGPSDGTALCLRSVGEPLPASGIVVGEAASVEDLRHWAKRRGPGAPAAGGSGYFSALLNEAGFAACETPAKPFTGFDAGRELFVCGTRSDSSRDFLDAAPLAGIPVFPLPEDTANGEEIGENAVRLIADRVLLAFRTARRVVLTVGLPLVREPAIARSLAIQLARIAAEVLRRGAIDRVFAEGGATAAGLMREMGWNRLQLETELAPGIATLALSNSKTRLIVKPGSYVWPKGIFDF